MDQQTIITLVVGIIVSVLGLLYRYWKPIDPLKAWLEMALSIVGSIVIALAMGKLAPPPGSSDPVAVIQYFLEMAAVVFALVQVVYNLVRAAFPQANLVARAFRR